MKIESLLSKLELVKTLSKDNSIVCEAIDAIISQIKSSRVKNKKIWHEVSKEVPTNCGADIFVACRNKNKEDGIWLYDLIHCWEGKWEPRVNWEDPVMWAYVDDLMELSDNDKNV